MKQLLSLLVCICYLLSGSVFLHAQSMDILEDSSMDTDCITHTTPTDTSSSESGCFDQCIGTYTDTSFQIIKKETLPSSDQSSLKYNILRTTTCPGDTLTAPSYIIDPGDTWRSQYIRHYIGSTKKLE